MNGNDPRGQRPQPWGSRFSEIHQTRSTRGLSPRFAVLVLRRLAHADRGNVTLLYVFFAMVLYASVALVWNTGRASTAHLKAQTAADTAAYQAALWTSRSMNMVTGTNMLIARNVSAFTIWTATIPTVTIANVIAGVKFGVCVAGCIASAGTACGCLAPTGIELAATLLWLAYFSPAMISGPGFAARALELHRYQRYWVEDLHRVVDEQRRILEQESGCEIRITTPGLDGQVRPPLVEGTALTFVMPLALRLLLRDHGWPDYSPFTELPGMDAVTNRLSGAANQIQENIDGVNERLGQIGDNEQRREDLSNKADLSDEEQRELDDLNSRKDAELDEAADLVDSRTQLEETKSKLDELKETIEASIFDVAKVATLKGAIWYGFLAATFAGTSIGFGNQHYTLTTGSPWAELSPTSETDWQPYSVVAVASLPGASQGMVARGLFSAPLAPRDRVLAYAEAETYNGIDQLITKAAHFPIPLPFPFRVWTPWGWQWQPRLTHGVHLDEAIQGDRVLREWFGDLGGDRTRVEAIQTRH